MGKTAARSMKDDAKKAFDRSPLGIAEKNIRRFYEKQGGPEKLSEELRGRVYDLRDETNKAIELFNEEGGNRLKALQNELADAIDEMLRVSMEKEFMIVSGDPNAPPPKKVSLWQRLTKTTKK